MKNPTIFNLAFLLIIIPLFTSCSFLKRLFGCDQLPSDENSVTILPAGGEYTLQNGFMLKVPANAVNKKTEISIKLLNNSRLQQIIDIYEFNNDPILAFIEGKPDGLVFNSPIEITFPASIEDEDIPLLYEVINDTSCMIASNTEIRLNSDQNEVTISISHFSSFFTAIITKLRDKLNYECLTTPCRCGNNVIIQGDKDFICNTKDCQISEVKLKITFPKCDGAPQEEFFAREVSGGCVPKLVISADSYIVKTNEQTNINATVKLGCEPIEKQDVDFHNNSNVRSSVNPTKTRTNENGSVNTTFIAGDEEGNVQVQAMSSVGYYRKTISASAGGTTEFNQGPLIKEALSDQINIQINDSVESWSGIISDETTIFGTIESTRNLEINFSFFVLKGTGNTRSIRGGASAVQKASVKSNDDCFYIKDLNVPSNLNLEVTGYVTLSTNELYLSLDRADGVDVFFDYTQCFSCDPPFQPHDCTPNGFHFNVMLNNQISTSAFITTGHIYLSEGVFSGSYSIYQDFIEKYTITLHKDL